jgi:hypothetical protein
MLARQYLACLAACVAGQVIGACIALIVAMHVFPGPDFRAMCLVILGSFAGLALTLLVLCGVVDFKTVDDGDPPLGIGA